MITHQTYNLCLDVLQEAQVSTQGDLYRVDFGPEVRPRHHYVDKTLRCTCPLGPACPAVLSAIEYCAAGGEPVADPQPGYFPTVPAVCPICQARTFFDSELSSRRRGAGWQCVQGGRGHYWQIQVDALRAKAAANPWRFPPVVQRGKEQLYAWEGVQEGDEVLYPGLLRADVGARARQP